MSFLLLLAAYLTLLVAIACKDYKKILALNVFSCLLAAAYLFFNDALVGASISTLAAFGSFSQLCLPKQECKLLKVTRNSIAGFLCMIATVILYSKPSDILPCLAFCNNRIMEAQGNAQLVRLGLAVGGLLWGIYGFYNGLYLYTLAEMLVCVSGLWIYLRTQRGLCTQSALQ